MMQKVVIRVSMTDQKKSRTKALQIAATVNGVESVALKGDERDQIEVIGEGIDTVELTRSLRKKVGCADLVSVGPAKEEKKEEKPPAAAAPTDSKALISMGAMPVWGTYPYASPAYPVYQIRDPEPSCNIM